MTPHAVQGWSRDRPGLAVLAVACMIPALNCGEIITDEHSLRHSTTVFASILCALCVLCA